eukprot:CAMPEP_0171310716 /NCGR_PEP_ID=MMETSP0816-20121228/20909_1 /TAXON_ID=420281 /ORGANISM="Proboscia inermis, Strain CCAP1064/1" /LENGTH=142 /DNA_ID=CAMNT_0011795005 /DNA_START=193 /DNA_END=621 /DNA_ORIENTATION=+
MNGVQKCNGGASDAAVSSIPSHESKSNAAISIFKGSYRHFTAMAHGLKWESVVEEKATDKNVSSTTMEEHKEQAAMKEMVKSSNIGDVINGNGNGFNNHNENILKEENDTNNMIAASKFKFKLDSGTYATMMFRELFHTTHE